MANPVDFFTPDEPGEKAFIKRRAGRYLGQDDFDIYESIIQRRQTGRTPRAMYPRDMQSAMMANEYVQNTSDPKELHNKLAAFFMNSEEVQDEQRMARFYGNGLDPMYQQPDGSIDWDAVTRDKFVLDFEKAYYNSRGKVPLSFFMTFKEDLDLFHGVPGETVEQLYRWGQIEAMHRQRQNQILADRINTSITLESMQGLSPIQQGIEGAQSAIGQLPLSPFLDTRQATVEDVVNATKKGALGTFRFFSGALGAGAKVLGWGATEVVGGNAGIVNQGLYQGANLINPLPLRDQHQQEMGYITKDNFLYSSLAGNLAPQFAEFQEVNPEEYAVYVAMAGGDTKLAEMFFADDFAFQENWEADFDKHLAQQVQIYDDETRYLIQEMEDEDYGTVPANLMRYLSAYGNVTMEIATGVTLLAKDFVGGDRNPFDDQFWEDLNGYDSPSEVLGLDGTLLGLGIDFAVSSLVDPTNFMFAGSLAGARWGASNIDDVWRYVNNPVAKKVLREGADVVRGSSRHSAVATQGYLDNLAVTGLEGDFLNAARGHSQVVFSSTPASAGAKPLRSVTQEVNVSFFDDLPVSPQIIDDPGVGVRLENFMDGKIDDYLETPPGQAMTWEEVEASAARADWTRDEWQQFHLREMLEKEGRERLDTEGWSPVEITINPDTGAAEITNNYDIYLALKAQGDDAIPLVIKSDLEYGFPSGVSVAVPDELVPRLGLKLDDPERLTQQALDRWAESGSFKQGGFKESPFWKAIKHTVGDEDSGFVPITDLEMARAAKLSDADILQNYRDQILARRLVERLAENEASHGRTLYRGHQFDGPTLPAVGETIDGPVWATSEKIDVAEGFYTAKVADDRAAAVIVFEDDLPSVGIYGPGRAVEAEHLVTGRFMVTEVTEVNGVPYVQVKHVEDLLDDIPARQPRDIPEQDWVRGSTTPADQGKFMGDDLYVNPNRMLSDEQLYGDMDIERLEKLYELHLSMGGDPLSGNRTAASVAIGKAIGDDFRNNSTKVGEWLDQYMTPINANSHVAYTGGFGQAQINQLGARLYSSVGDYKGWEPYQRAIQNFWREKGKARQAIDDASAEMAVLNNYKRALQSEAGGLDDMSSVLGGQLDEESVLRRLEIDDELQALQPRIDELNTLQRETVSRANNYDELTNILDDMMDDFNRRYIATRPDWKWAVNEETGLVDWELISGRTFRSEQERAQAVFARAKKEKISVKEAAQGELGFVPKGLEDLDEAIESLGMNLNDFLDEAIEALNHRSTYAMPASPLEIMSAATGGPKATQSVTARLMGQGAADFAHNLQMMWVLDKVMTPRTGVTVSLDELLFGWHAGGGKSVLQYAEDKAAQVAARVSRIKNSDGWERLPQRWKDRLTALEEYPIYLRQQERAFLELGGYGFDEITFKRGPLYNANNVQYYEAAQRQTQLFLNDPGFQAYLKGPGAFQEWWENAATAARARSIEIVDIADKTKKVGITSGAVYDGYEAHMNWALRNIRSKKKARARQIWQDAAERAAAKDSTAAGPTTLPEWVLEGYGSVTGNRNNVTSPIAKFMNEVSERAFSAPLQYRRGANAEMIRAAERARLNKLYASQGKRVLPEHEIRDLIRTQNPTWTEDMVSASMDNMAESLFRQHGVLSQRYVDELVETKVVTEIEKMMYSFTYASRGAVASKAVAPFGKPYADMMARWGRSLFERPKLRGWIHDSNILNRNQIMDKALDKLPFNPKTAAFLSRVAAQDYELDRLTEDPIFGKAFELAGVTSADLSAGLFLPNQNTPLFAIAFPGLGWAPTGALRMMVEESAPDPIKDPLAYQRWVDKWSEYFPSLAYSHPTGLVANIAQSYLGGGTSSKLLRILEAAQRGLTGSTSQAIISQSWSSRVAANRHVKSLLADPDTLRELAELPPEVAELGLTAILDEKLAALTVDATGAQAAAEIKELGANLMVPAGLEFDTIYEDLNSVWLDAGPKIGVELPSWIQTGTPEKDRVAAEYIRSQFFGMESWQRDAAVAANPELAVNLVSMWRWSDTGLATNIPGNDMPYRSGGGKVDQERHQTYLAKGYIQPIDPRTYAQLIIGTQASAKTRAASQMYTVAAAQINDSRWEALPEDWKTWLDAAAVELEAEGLLPYRTGRELWNNYSDLKENMDRINPPPEGETGFSMPTKYRAYGETRPGSADQLREDFQDGGWAIAEPSPQLAELAQALGFSMYDVNGNWRPVQMQEIWQFTADYISESLVDNPLYMDVQAAYMGWLDPRGSGLQATTTIVGRVIDHEQFTDEQRFAHKRNLVYISEALDRRAVNDPTWRQVRDEAAGSWARMFQDDAFQGMDAKMLWDQAYGKSLGPLDWVPDEPPPLVFEDGGANPNSSQIYVREVLDGDTLDFRYGPRSETYRLRILGYNAQELGAGGEGERNELKKAIEAALASGMPISIVRDPERYGYTDMYGRNFAWLYIGDEPWYNPDTMIPGSS